MNRPTLSICIPTFNRANLLKLTLESIISQITDNVEIVISDNSSTDNTQDVIEDFRGQYPNIRYYTHQENVGFDGNILRLINYANGDYIFFCSDDDIVINGTIKSILDLISSSSFSLISLNYYSFKGENFSIPYTIYKKNQADIVFNDRNRHIQFISYNLGFISSIVINRIECIKIMKQEPGYVSSGFIQLYISLLVLLSDLPSAWIGSYCIAQRTDTGGWFPLKYFGYELPRIFHEFEKRGYKKSVIRKIINESLLKLTLPSLISWRSNVGDKEVLETKNLIISVHSKNPVFWIFVFPFYLIPNRILRVLFRTLRQAKRSLKGVK